MNIYAELIKAPHVLIGGTTGSGKSVLLNGFIREVMTEKTPEAVQLVLVDPKRVELSPYKNTMFCREYTAEASDVPGLLDRAISLIEARYKGMEEAGTKETTKYHLYIVVDELADLMISEQAKQIKTKLQKILQIGRAAGVHIIAATQAPNRKIIPAELVLNFTHRIALRCLSPIESRQIVNVAGAETLPKYGKGVYLSPDGIARVDIPLTPDCADIVKAWTREKPLSQPVRQSNGLVPKQTQKQTVDFWKIVQIAGCIIGVLWLWAIM